MNSAEPTQPRATAGQLLKNSRRTGGAIRLPSLTDLAALALAATLAACGSKTSGGKAETLSPTGVCAASATPATAPPYAIEFQFRNDTAAPLFLLKGCGSYAFGVSSCAAGFSDRLNDAAFCACSCDEPQCGTTCGACEADEGTGIVGGDSLRRPWSGVSVTTSPSAFGECVTSRDLPAGRYRVSIWVYDSAQAAVGHSGARVVSQDFELPAPNGLVDVPLGPSAEDTCDPTPDAPVAACTGAEAHGVPCALATTLTFANDGGLSQFHDSETLSPPATDVRSRAPFGTATASTMCTTQLPRCSRDARVTTTGDVTRALAQPGVAAAFGASTPVFGSDPRPADGQILIVKRADGTSFGIGGPCSDCARPLTPALRTLGTVLQTLSFQQFGDPACASLAAR
jgi:hypothetical protein